ncbi:prepilin-type N-terminal cleavage/methylation domain-containing protein [Deefgea piscis]|uniref:Prepilin-type N-terminal cleavage/methylation domain-containing protein n=1 Tax=Deefgea piscis TaxID=2739061 RepID=A0A6M8SQ35_9NEIS|nr:prepilin-type N-terminal cleavage/methylation domain-containing protein [Deefgea piscis]QKJ65376.1 prepilin-type N-terminal cleavage/methylation domain-containing protein [Deefgea piscis]
MLKKSLLNQSGISLIEILIAMAISLALLTAAATMALASLSSSKDTLQNTAAQQELQTILTTVTREIRRSGYRSPAMTPVEEIAENAKSTTTFRKIWTFGGTTCIVYRYDSDTNADPLLPPGNGLISNDEVRGIRLDSTNNRIDFLTSATSTTAPTSCDSANGTWTPLVSGKSIQLGTDALKFEYSSGWIRIADGASITSAQALAANAAVANSAAEVIDQVKISISGTLPTSTTANPKIIESSEMVQLRNRPFKFN